MEEEETLGHRLPKKEAPTELVNLSQEFYDEGDARVLAFPVNQEELDLRKETKQAIRKIYEKIKNYDFKQ